MDNDSWLLIYLLQVGEMAININCAKTSAVLQLNMTFTLHNYHYR